MTEQIEWKECIRYFSPKEYEEQTQDFYHNGKLLGSDGAEVRVVKDKDSGIYLFNPKYNTIPNVIAGKYIGCGPINEGDYVSPEEVLAQFK